MKENHTNNTTIIIRAGQGTLSFLIKRGDGTNDFYPYAVKSEMSLAANLREAFKTLPYLKEQADRTILMISSPIQLIPQEEYSANGDEFDAETMYGSVMTGHKGEEKIIRPMPTFDAVGVFTINSDLHMVVTDNCPNVEVRNVMYPVWQHLYSRYYQSGQRRKLFAYFHDKMVDVCQFEQGRVRFANSFDATHAHDALYYILFVWKQLGMNQEEDDLFVIGEIPHEKWLRGRLQTYLARLHDINPSADLNRSPLAEIKDMPFDMMIDF